MREVPLIFHDLANIDVRDRVTIAVDGELEVFYDMFLVLSVENYVSDEDMPDFTTIPAGVSEAIR